MTDAEIIADMFGCPPCNFSPADEEMMTYDDYTYCETHCGQPEQTDAACWQRYFDLKRNSNKK